MNTNGWMKSLIMLAKSDDVQLNGMITVMYTLPVCLCLRVYTVYK